MDLSSLMAASPSYGKAVDTYKKAVAAAATVTAYTVLARSMTRELLPDELRASARWAASILRGRLLPRPEKLRRTKTIFIPRHVEGSPVDSRLYWDARAYLATRIDADAMSQLCLSVGAGSELLQQLLISMVPGDSMTDVFEGVEFTWGLTAVGAAVRRRGDDIDGDHGRRGNRLSAEAMVLSFDAEHMEVALRRYVPFIQTEMKETRRRERTLKIFMNNERPSWEGFNHNHPATFDTVAMDPALKQSITADLDRFMGRRDYYRRIGKAWKRGYLLYGPPGTGKSSLVAAMANYLHFNLYDLDISYVHSNIELQKLLISMPNKSILVIEDVDCCFTAESRENQTKNGDGDCDSDDCTPDSSDEPPPKACNFAGPPRRGITLSGLLNCIDGLWSTSGEARIIVFTTNYKDRLDPALLRPGRMDMPVYMGYCGWEAFKTLARNYFLVDDHPLFPEIQALLSTVEVTPAEVSEMLLRSEDADVVLQGLVELLQGKKMKKQGGKP